MPTYEYACSACANEWEAEQSIKADALKECPKCHEQTARRQISRGGGFILKGGGWYNDLYSSPSNKPEAKPTGDAAAAPSGESKGDAKTETKTETKTSEAKSDTAAAPAASTPAKGDSSTAV